MSPTELSLGRHVDVRVVRDEDRQVTRGYFRCRCGWETVSSGAQLVVPDKVKAHARVCPHANPDQVTLEDLMAGGGAS